MSGWEGGYISFTKFIVHIASSKLYTNGETKVQNAVDLHFSHVLHKAKHQEQKQLTFHHFKSGCAMTSRIWSFSKHSGGRMFTGGGGVPRYVSTALPLNGTAKNRNTSISVSNMEWRGEEAMAQSKSTRSQKPSPSRSSVVTIWMGDHYVLGFVPTQRILRREILYRLYKSPLDETINWGPPCAYACKKITNTCSRICSPCRNLVDYGNTKNSPACSKTREVQYVCSKVTNSVILKQLIITNWSKGFMFWASLWPFVFSILL